MPDPAPSIVALVDPVSGEFFNVPQGDASYYIERGWRQQTAADVGSAALRGAREADYGGISGAVKAGLAAGARGATLGLSDVAARALGDDETVDTLRALREEHPGLSTGAEVAGAILPAFFTGGETLPASFAGRVGTGVAEAVGGGVRGALAGDAAAGALFGVGHGASELALSRDRLTLGHAAATLSSNALYGAAAGTAAGGAIRGVGAGLGAAKRALDRALLARSEGRAMKAVDALGADAAAHPGIGTEVEIEYPGTVEPPPSVQPSPPPPAAPAMPPGRIEVREIGRTEQMRATMPDGTTRDLGKDGADKFLAEQMPAGFRPEKVQTHWTFYIENGLPASAEDIAKIEENAIYVAKPSELAKRDLWGNELIDAKRDKVLELWKQGEKLPPIDAYVMPEGRIYIEDGNHRLQGAARTDREVAIRFRDGTNYIPQGSAREIGDRIRAELPKGTGPSAPSTGTTDPLAQHRVTTRIEELAADGARPERLLMHVESPTGNGFLSAERLPDGTFAVGRTALDLSLRGKGVGTAAYQRLNEAVESKYGTPLMSAARADRSPSAEGLWQRLEQRGLAQRVGVEVDGRPERWVMTRPAGGRAKVPLSSLDKKGLDLAEKVETERALAARQPERDRFVDALEEAHKAREPDKEWLSIVADRNPDKYAREQAKVLFNVDRRVRNLLDNRVGLAERPARATEWLQQERQALDGLIERGRAQLDQYREAASTAPETVRRELRAGRLDGFKMDRGGIPAAIPPGSPIIDDIVAREVQARFPRDADGVLIVPRELAGFEDARLQLARNRNLELQQRIENLAREPHSERLSQIAAARDALGSRTAPPRPETTSPVADVLKLAAHAVPFGGVAEKAVSALGGLRKAVGAGTERVARAASTFLGAAAPVVGKAATVAPPVATMVLAALRYGEPEPDERGKRRPEPKTLPELYRARTDEIKSQVQLAPDGTYQMRPDARVRMAARLSGLGTIDPIAADRLESAGAARIAWLASQMPRRPDLAGLPVGPDNWQPSDAAMRAWARKAAAAEDPYGVLERASAGAKARVVPEEIMAMRALQPALLNDYITRVITGLPERKTRLPYAQRLALSMLTGRPLDPAMTPVVLRELQSMHAGEPGTAGGTMAPRSSPQFGSVKRSDPGTPAQRRQGVGI